MPKIEQYGANRINTQVTQGAQQQTRSAADFAGNHIAKGLGDVSNMLSVIQDDIDTTHAEDANTQFRADAMSAMYDPESGFFNTHGKDSVDAADNASETLKQLREFHAKSLTGVARRKFDAASKAYEQQMGMKIGAHKANGFQTWKVANLDAEMKNAIIAAGHGYSDPIEVSTNLGIAAEAVADKLALKGIHDAKAVESEVATAHDAIVSNVLENAMAESATAGQAALDKYGDMLINTKGKWQVRIDKKLKAEKSANDAGIAVAAAGKYADRFDGGSVTDLINTIKGDYTDAALREKVTTEAVQQWTRLKSARLSDQTKAMHEATTAVMVQNETAATLEVGSPEIWNKLSDIQKMQIRSGKFTQTDPQAFSRLMSMPPAEFLHEDMGDYVNVMAPADMKKLVDKADDIRQGKSVDHTMTDSQAITSAALALLGKNSVKDKEKMDQFRRAADSILAAASVNDDKLTPPEKRQLLVDGLQGFERDYSIFSSKPDDATLGLGDTPPLVLSTLNNAATVLGIDPENDEHRGDIITVYEDLKDRGVPITANNVAKAYQQKFNTRF